MIYHDVRPLEPLRLISIDPGTETVGVALFEVNQMTNTKTLIEAFTIQGSLVSYREEAEYLYASNREHRLQGILNTLYSYFLQSMPHVVVVEDNYLRHSPKSFKALIEAVSAIRQAVLWYLPTCLFYTVTPMQAKSVVNATKKASDKNLVRIGVLAYSSLQAAPGLVESLDEHSIDAVAIGLYAIEQILLVWGQIHWSVPSG